MTPAELEEERKKIYAITRQDLLVRNLSNSEKYDNAILTLATGILGISLAFIKDIVPLGKAEFIPLLKLSWWLFGAAIVSTLVSFAVSQLAIKRQLEYAERYYLEGKEEFLNQKNHPALLTEYINYASGGLFILGIIASVCFVSMNVKGGHTMSKDTNQPINEGAPIPKLQGISPAPEKGSPSVQHLQGGATVPTLQRVATTPGERGATVPAMQPVTQSTQTDRQSQGSQGQQTGRNADKK